MLCNMIYHTQYDLVYPSNRKQCYADVYLSGDQLVQPEVHHVPQGVCVAPLHFNRFINAIFACLVLKT